MNREEMSREGFKEILEEVMASSDYQKGLNKYFQEHGADGYIFQPDCICSVIKLLHFIFKEKDEKEWIRHFCFELDFGRKEKPEKLQDEKGKAITLKTIDDLYQILTK